MIWRGGAGRGTESKLKAVCLEVYLLALFVASLNGSFGHWVLSQVFNGSPEFLTSLRKFGGVIDPFALQFFFDNRGRKHSAEEVAAGFQLLATLIERVALLADALTLREGVRIVP